MRRGRWVAAMAFGCATPPEDVAPRRVIVALDVGQVVGRARGATALARVRAPLPWPGTATQPAAAAQWTTRLRATRAAVPGGIVQCNG